MKRFTRNDPTPDLDTFLEWYECDDNVWWATDCGHHLNLFEAAVVRMRACEGER